jgi:hypothetical protein
MRDGGFCQKIIQDNENTRIEIRTLRTLVNSTANLSKNFFMILAVLDFGDSPISAKNFIGSAVLFGHRATNDSSLSTPHLTYQGERSYLKISARTQVSWHTRDLLHFILDLRGMQYSSKEEIATFPTK